MATKRKRPSKPKRKIGRQSKLDPVITSKLIALLQQGHTIEIACNAIGLHKATYHRWMEKGESQQPGQQYRDFRDQVTASRAVCEVMLLDTLQKAARTDWRAAQWLLERLFGDRYADKTKFLMEHRGKINGHVTHEHEHKQIVVIIPSAIATPRPLPKQINARETPPPA